MFSFCNSAKGVLSLGYQHTAQVLILRTIWRKSAHWTALLSTHWTFGSSGSNVAPDFLKCQMSSETISLNLKPNTKKPCVCYCGILNKRNLAFKTKWGSCLAEFTRDPWQSVQHGQCAAWSSKPWAFIPSLIIQKKTSSSAQNQGPELWIGRIVHSFNSSHGLLKELTVLHKLDDQVKISEKRGLPLCLTNPTFGRPCGQPSDTQARRAWNYMSSSKISLEQFVFD